MKSETDNLNDAPESGRKSRTKTRWTVVVPTLNEAGELAECLASIRREARDVEVIVVDGGSTDATVTIAKNLGARVIRRGANRGMQFNAGCASANGDILLFLHGDTRLPENAFDLIEARFSDPGVQIATFRLGFDRKHWLLRLYGWFTRFDSVFTRFGDQCIVVRREFLTELGGFPEWPLLEDVELLRRARRKTRVHSLPAAIETAARRFSRNGLVRQQLRNGFYLLRYLLGADPEDIARRYSKGRGLPATSALILFARYPEPGKVKTRLARTIGKGRATEFYSICAQRIFAECSKLPMTPYLFYTDTDDAAAMRDWAGWSFMLKTQQGSDLGERIQNAFRHVFDQGAGKAIIIGTDVPDLRADLIRRAEAYLEDHDLVIGPCPDGGYYLLGMKCLHADLFRQIPWSTVAVYQITLAKAKAQGLVCAVLPELADIDTRDELIRWSQMDRNRDDNPVFSFALQIQESFALKRGFKPGEP